MEIIKREIIKIPSIDEVFEHFKSGDEFAILAELKNSGKLEEIIIKVAELRIVNRKLKKWEIRGAFPKVSGKYPQEGTYVATFSDVSKEGEITITPQGKFR